MAGGRPTEYDDEIRLKAIEYVSICDDTEEDKENRIARKVRLPSIEGLAYYIKVNKDTIYEWCKVHPEFSDVIDDLRAKQADRLLNNGLAGTYNPTIAKVLLTKHGYRDAVDTDITTKGEKVTTGDPKLVALAQRYEDEIKKDL